MRAPLHVCLASSRAVLVLVLAGCSHPTATTEVPLTTASPSVTASAPPSAPVASASVAPSASVSAAPPCIYPAYQRSSCLPPDGPLDDDAARAWFVARGVKVEKDFPGYNAHCTEVTFGPGAVPSLACTVDHFAPGILGANGPMIWHRDLRLLSVRGKGPGPSERSEGDGRAGTREFFEYARLPVAFTEANQWGHETLFAALPRIDGAAGTLDLVVNAEECADARKGVTEYHTDWAAQVAGDTAQVKARQLQIRADLARIDLTCKAAGHYVLGKSGRLERAK